MYSREQFVTSFGIDPSVCPQGDTDNRGRFPAELSLSKGSHHATALAIAGLMRRRGASEEEISRVLHSINSGAFDVPEDDAEVNYLAHDVAKRYASAIDDYIWSEAGLSDVFVGEHGSDLRYCAELGGWFVWDGKRWARDKANQALQRVKETIRGLIIRVEAEPMTEENKKHLQFLIRSETAARCRAILELSQPTLAIRMEDFDQNPLLFNVNNGTLDLSLVELRPHNREDYLTKISPVNYDPEARCDLFLSFLDRIFRSDQELISYFQRVLGYALTALITGQCWFLLYGRGSNGKSTLMCVILFIFGDYARQTPPETFLRRKGEVIRNDLARLQGARLISTSEPPSSGKLDESLLKAFTGGDRVTARFLHKEFFEYEPVGKIFMASNNLLKVQDSDHGFWRRVRLIPFKVRIPDNDQDLDLPVKLEQEASGILTWMVEGYREWRREGFGAPESAQEAVDDYRAEMDVLADFLANPLLEFGEGMRVSKAGLYDFYSDFHGGESHVGMLTRDAFNRALRARGFETCQVGVRRVRSWVGIGLRNDMAEPATS